MKRTLVILPILVLFCAVLIACSDTTLVDLRISALPLIPQEERSKDIPIIRGLSDGINFPNEVGFSSEEIQGLPVAAYEGLQKFNASLAGEFTLLPDGNTVTPDLQGATIELELFISQGNSAFVGAPITIKQNFVLDLGQTSSQTLSFSVDETQYSELLTLLRTGSYKLGFRMVATDESNTLGTAGIFRFTLTDFKLNLVTKANGFGGTVVN